jgi:FG-GAP repeat
MNGTQFVCAQIIGTVGPEWRFIATGDVNGDGRADLVFRRNNGQLALFQMDGFTVVSADVVATIGTGLGKLL